MHFSSRNSVKEALGCVSREPGCLKSCGPVDWQSGQRVIGCQESPLTASYRSAARDI
jgi:hypothetical protein